MKILRILQILIVLNKNSNINAKQIETKITENFDVLVKTIFFLIFLLNSTKN